MSVFGWVCVGAIVWASLCLLIIAAVHRWKHPA